MSKELFVNSEYRYTFSLSFFGSFFRQKCVKMKRFQGDLNFLGKNKIESTQIGDLKTEYWALLPYF